MLVSIVCNTYNHELYIRDALDGFLNQKTIFPYEILIYDDASTDKTAEIIKEYEKKYPDKIKPIYQTVNQYSLGLKPGKQNRERANGKYIAICEGDDYWIDENKLQEQIDYMESHPDCTFCFTNGFTKYGDVIKDKIIPWNKSSIVPKNKVDYDVGEINLMGYIPTASFVFRNYEIPTPSNNAFGGDLYIESVMTNYGYAHFIDKQMVVYRRAISNSATAIWNKNTQIYANQCEKFIAMFQILKDICKHKYDDVFNARICQWKIEKYSCLNDFKALKDLYCTEEIKYLKKLSFNDRIKYHIKGKYCKQFNQLRRYIKG